MSARTNPVRFIDALVDGLGWIWWRRGFCGWRRRRWGGLRLEKAIPAEASVTSTASSEPGPIELAAGRRSVIATSRSSGCCGL